MEREDLRNNVIFWSRLGYFQVAQISKGNFRNLLENESLSEIEYHKKMDENGIKLHSFILPAGWEGEGVYDYTQTFAVMDEAVKIAGDAMLLPRVKLDAPVDWCKNHPEELFLYYEAPHDVEEIRQAIGTSRHDLLGYESEGGTYLGNSKFSRRNEGGVVSRQSFSSDLWLRDAKIALKKLIEQLEKRYPDKIIGYHVAYGTSGETILWGRINERFGDYGISHLKKFKSFLKEKYGVEGELPPPGERYSKKGTLTEFLRLDNKLSLYHDEFMNEVNSHAAEELCKTVKETSPKSLTGVFYGYFMGVENIAYTGHTQISRLIHSPYVDFFAAPKTYYRCKPGDSCGEFSASQSVNLQKVWVDECDVRTHYAKNVPENWSSDNFQQTKNALVRELSKNMSHNSGMWFMDLGGGWYNAPNMYELLHQLNDISLKVRSKPHCSVSDVLFITDEKGIMQTSVSRDFMLGYQLDFTFNLKKAGVLLDIYRREDLRNIDLSRYKLIVFAYGFHLDRKAVEYIRTHSTAKIMFNYAAGCISEGKLDFQKAKEVTGFDLNESKPRLFDFPDISAKNYDSILLENEKGKVYALRDGRMLNTIPYPSVEELRRIIRFAECHCYIEKDFVLYGDQRFLTVIGNKNGYKGEILLQEEKEWENLITGEKGKGDRIAIDFAPYDTAVFAF